MHEVSALQKARHEYSPKLPGVLKLNGARVKPVSAGNTESVADQAAIKQLFKNTYGLPVVNFAGAETPLNRAVKAGVILSGGQAPGGHNVIAGLYDGLKAMNPQSELYGFLGGPSGLTDNKYRLLTGDMINGFRNTGGFDMIGSGRTKLETPEQFDKTAANCVALGIEALVIVGGDDSNTNACMLAEYFLKHNKGIRVIGCPKTIDGDLKNAQIATSFGFDTATKVYSELVGNIQRDSASAKKYWHFVRLMGRSASHITLECALQTHPNVTLISEEIQEKRQTLLQVAESIAAVIRQRAAAGKDYGVVLVPEGLIEFIPEIKTLIAELNDRLAEMEQQLQACDTFTQKSALVAAGLSPESSAAFKSLPGTIQQQLLMDRDPHGNVQVSRIETEKLLMEMIEIILKKYKEEGSYKGKFSAQNHFFGYEGRCAAPSNFDADYCYSLGYTAALLTGAGMTGYMAAVHNLIEPADKWVAGGIPLTMLMNIERRHGADRPVIRKSLVELNDKPFLEFAAQRDKWAAEDSFVFPGPIQYFGPSAVCDCTTITLQLELS